MHRIIKEIKDLWSNQTVHSVSLVIRTCRTMASGAQLNLVPTTIFYPIISTREKFLPYKEIPLSKFFIDKSFLYRLSLHNFMVMFLHQLYQTFLLPIWFGLYVASLYVINSSKSRDILYFLTNNLHWNELWFKTSPRLPSSFMICEWSWMNRGSLVFLTIYGMYIYV